MKHQYSEGPEILERFKALMTRAFQAPKSKTPFAKAKKAGSKATPKKRVRKPHQRIEDITAETQSDAMVYGINPTNTL